MTTKPPLQKILPGMLHIKDEKKKTKPQADRKYLSAEDK
jgi:hypothetical protein